MKKLLPLISIFLYANTFAIDPSVQTNLINISDAIDRAVKRAQNAFPASGAGNVLDANIDILDTDGGNSMYLQVLQINRQFNICIQFKSSSPTSTKGTSHTVPISTALWGKKIVLVAIYDTFDEQLSNFECVTDADEGIQHFVGQKAPAEGNKSYISNFPNVGKYLGSCVYLEEATINTVTASTSLWTNWST